MRPRAAFLDRDGTLNIRRAPHEYVTSPHQFRWLAGAAAGAARLHHAGFKLIVVSNQRGMARGMVSAEVLRQVEDIIQGQLAQHGCQIESFKYCPHDLADDCDCRKPRPGMLLAAADELQLDLSRSWMIGDSPTDMVAGRSAGCRTALIGPDSYEPKADIAAGTLALISQLIIAREEAHLV